MKILVLSGSDSPERVVSLRSGNAVADAARSAGFEVSVYDPIDGDEGLAVAVNGCDIVFPILHGVQGEDGTIQKKLDDLGKLYLGSTADISAMCFNKVKSHEALESSGILMPAYAVVTKNDVSNPLFVEPFVLKPIEGGSSVDTLIAREVSEKTIQEASKLLGLYDEMIVEELIEGRELTVAVLDTSALPVIAIVPPAEGEFDFENKYNGRTQELCPAPINLITSEKQQEAQALALQVHLTLGARHLSRTDMMLDHEGRLFVLELNTIPGLTEQSLFPKAAKAAGFDMPQLVKIFAELVQRSV